MRRLISGQVPCIHSGPSHPGYPPWDSNPDPRGLNALALPIGLEGYGAADRVRTGDLNVGNVVLSLLSYNRMEPAPRVELGPPPYHGGVLPLSPSRPSWDAWIRTTTTAVKARRPAVSRHPMGSLLPGSNRHPARYRRAALIQLRQGGRGSALGGTRTRNIRHLGPVWIPDWSTSTYEPQRGLEPRTPPLRRACSDRLSYRGAATRAGIEPACS